MPPIGYLFMINYLYWSCSFPVKNAAFGYDRVTLSAVKRLLSQSQVIFTKLECDKLVAVISLPLIFCRSEFFFDFLLNSSIFLSFRIDILSELFKQNLSHDRFTLCYNSPIKCCHIQFQLLCEHIHLLLWNPFTATKRTVIVAQCERALTQIQNNLCIVIRSSNIYLHCHVTT